MPCISFIIGSRGLIYEEILWEIVCPKSLVGVRFDFAPLIQGQI